MNRIVFFCFSAAVMLSALYGCGATNESTAPADIDAESAHGEQSGHNHSNHSQSNSEGTTDMDKMKAQLAKLSPEDAASAEKQQFCPVSGEMLGLMGPPLKVDVNGQQVWICCEGCKDELLADPDKYLAKLQDGSSHE